MKQEQPGRFDRTVEGNADGIGTAYERMLRSDVKYRFVIDVASMGG